VRVRNFQAYSDEVNPVIQIKFLYALRREVVRNGFLAQFDEARWVLFLYALRREVVRNCPKTC